MNRSQVLAVALSIGACTPDPLVVGSVERCALGVYLYPGAGDPKQELETVETLVGGKFDFERLFLKWDDAFPIDYLKWTVAQGRVPVISWNARALAGPIAWSEIAAASEPAVLARIQQVADQLQSLEGRVLLNFHQEPNTDPEFGTPDEFIAAWQRIVDVFRARGAHNVEWVWSLTSGAFPVSATNWYPGDAHVDWIGATGVNWFTGAAEASWRPLSAIFVGLYEWGVPREKSLLLLHYASVENGDSPPDGPRSKSTWIREGLDTLKAWPEVQAAIYLHHPGTEPSRSWKFDSSPESLEAFRAIAADPYFDTSGAARR